MLLVPLGHESLPAVQVLPFQISANETRPPLSPVVPVPTATQVLADGHDTPVRSASSLALAGTETDILAQVLPFHESASAKPPVLVPELPTVMQRAADVHDTLLSWLMTLPLGTGGLDRVHLPPFQDSASAALPDAVKELPTATQLLAAAQDTPRSWPPLLPLGVAGALAVQVLPFQVSTSGTPLPPALR